MNASSVSASTSLAKACGASARIRSAQSSVSSANARPVSRGCRAAWRSPAWVQPSTSLRTRSGASSATSWAIIPPIDIPNTSARSIASASSSATASAASPAVVYGPGVTLDAPPPRLS